MKDILGNEIRVGDRVAYGRRVGDQAHIVAFDVAEVLEDKIKGTVVAESSGRRSTRSKSITVHCIDRIVKVSP